MYGILKPFGADKECCMFPIETLQNHLQPKLLKRKPMDMISIAQQRIQLKLTDINGIVSTPIVRTN